MASTAVPFRQTLGGRKLWESKDERKWGHDKYEELTLQERHHDQGRRGSMGRFRGRGRNRGTDGGPAHGNRPKEYIIDNNQNNKNQTTAPNGVRGRGPRRYQQAFKNNNETPVKHNKQYGENVAEANLKSYWLCPVCRGICNCSRCRRNKGWAPTGVIYKEVKKLGYKSVAHYLIYTQRGQAKTEVTAAVSPISADGSLAIDDKKEGSSDAITQQGAEKNEMAEDNLKVDSDEEFRGDDYEDEEEEEESR